MAVPTLRILIDGDCNKVYRRGDKVTGRVSFVAEEQEHIESFKLIFVGSCITKTTRPSKDSYARKEFEERIRFFNCEREVVPRSTLNPNKYSWAFDFTFPQTTQQSYKRLSRGAHYLREPHPLPPSFQLETSIPGGAAQISYFVQARLVLGGSKGARKVKQMLQYRPTSRENLPREPNLTASVLYGQTWKPSRSNESRSTVDKVLRRSSNKPPSIVPTIFYPEKIVPGQHIPLSMCLLNSRDRMNEAQAECTIDSLSLTISTYSTTMCGHTLTQPEDVVSKHVNCIAKTNMNRAVPFNKTQNLTTNFRLVNDAECIPTFKTYTITRRYMMSITVGIRFGDQHFTVRHNAPLEILPRPPCSLSSPPFEEGEEAEPLPMYTPREPSREFAPHYESIYALSRTSSTSESLARWNTASSVTSGTSTAATETSMPASEVDEPLYERRAIIAS
ncbi:uncharacterized protein M421DRAFT_72277 [Didymella exigua CBS 183.55]|uniref:Arrestin-like N-terminal domain-containing protein n=1 Tax=Didymella exigua CBS 183.55 TaxID=1150837 RepID=A0A6A5RFL8_9PLEO|nr:uncharacterized protein M421DRAFT_72277 [Didymella exigua CBS 183.55]KAF1924467.1 hypothetical protein M421DRAFT_72277 [Didymella exigua CBS 183.55]